MRNRKQRHLNQFVGKTVCLVDKNGRKTSGQLLHISGKQITVKTRDGKVQTKAFWGGFGPGFGLGYGLGYGGLGYPFGGLGYGGLGYGGLGYGAGFGYPWLFW